MTSTPTFSQDIPVPDDVMKAATEFQNMVDRDPRAYAAFDVAVLAIMADRQRAAQSKAMDELIADSADEIVPLADRQSHSAVRRLRLTGEDADAVKRMIAEGRVFADTDPEAQFIADAELSCPHCGGSGHKDDVRDHWLKMDTAPKDGTEFVALERWKDTGRVYARVYRWEGPPNYWNAKREGVCIRPEYQDRYLWMPLPPAPSIQGEG